MNKFKDLDLPGLLKFAKNQEIDALAELYERFYPKVLKYMYYRVSPADAEDLAGEVFVRVLRSIEKQFESFEAWLYRIAANVIIDRARRIKVRKESEMNETMAETLAVKDPPEAGLDRNADITDAMEQLTDEQKEFVVLKFLQGLSNEDTGAIMNRNAGALRALQFRALSALRDILKNKGDK